MKLKAVILTLVILEGLAYAQVQRTFVSAATGNDVNPCSRPRPCRSFGAALVQTLPEGEIVVLDSGGYGPVTINQSVQIEAVGVYAGVTAFSGDAITIAGAADKVTLRGLTINGLGGGRGISFLAGSALHVEDCVINGFLNQGMAIDSTIAAVASVNDTIFRGNGLGMFARSNSSFTHVSVDQCRFEKTGHGVAAFDNSRITVRNSVSARGATSFRAFALGAGTTAVLVIENCISASGADGVFLGGSGGVSLAAISNSHFVNHSITGIRVSQGSVAYVSGSTISDNVTGIDASTNALVRVSDTTITRNGTGLITATGGSIHTRTPASNTLEANTADGAFTGTFAAE
jgi:parallel beta helix pectate lyase-like protein